MSKHDKITVEFDESSSNDENKDLDSDSNDSDSEEIVEYDSEDSDQESDTDIKSEIDSDEETKDDIVEIEDTYAQDKNTKHANPKWANSIARILQTKTRKSESKMVLSESKKLTDPELARAKPVGFDIEKPDGHVVKALSDVPEQKKRPRLTKAEKMLLKIGARKTVIADVMLHERMLRKLAAQGVVQLFNAVEKQQLDMAHKLEDAGKSEIKRDHVRSEFDREAFLKQLAETQHSDHLAVKKRFKAMKRIKAKLYEQEEAKRKADLPTWSLLRDGLAKVPKLRDWKEGEHENDHEIENN